MNYDLRNSAEDKSQRMLNAVPFGQADSQFKSLKFKVVGQADGTPQGLRLKNYSAVKEKSCIFAAE